MPINSRDWARRMYVGKESFPEQERRPTSKENWNQTLEIVPEQAEFNRDLPKEFNSPASLLLKQSEHKKPYVSKGYEPMEYELEAPPGFGPELPPTWNPPPGINWPGDPVLPPGLPGEPGEGGTLIIFDIEPEVIHEFDVPWYSYRVICPGTWTLLDLNPTWPVTSVQLVGAPTGTEIEYLSSDRRFVYVRIPPDSLNFGGLLRIRAYMEAIGGITGSSVANVDVGDEFDEKCPSIYFYFEVQVDTGVGLYTRSFVWDFWREEFPSDIPDGTPLGGTVINPGGQPADFAYWLGLLSGPDALDLEACCSDTCTFTFDIIPQCDAGLNGIGDDYNDVIYARCNGSQFYDSASDCEVICSFCSPPPPPDPGECFTTRSLREPAFPGVFSGKFGYGAVAQEFVKPRVLMVRESDVFFEQNVWDGSQCVDTGTIVQVNKIIEWYADIDGTTFGSGGPDSGRQFTLLQENNFSVSTNNTNYPGDGYPSEPNINLNDIPRNPDGLITLSYYGVKTEDWPGGGNANIATHIYFHAFYNHSGFILNNQLNQSPTGTRISDIEDAIQDIIDDAKTAFPGFTSLGLNVNIAFRQGVYKPFNFPI